MSVLPHLGRPHHQDLDLVVHGRGAVNHAGLGSSAGGLLGPVPLRATQHTAARCGVAAPARSPVVLVKRVVTQHL